MVSDTTNALCLVTGELITDENDSRAHVIPSALGGRLKPKGILSAKGNSILNDKFDLPLVNAFQPIMSLLGGVRDRGNNPKSRLTDINGTVYEVSFDAPTTLAKPEYHERPIQGGVEIQIRARTEKEARTLLGKVKSKYPGFDIDSAMKDVVLEQRYLDVSLKASLQIGPVVTFPATFVAASLYACSLGLPHHPDFANYVEIFDPTVQKPVLPPNTFCWYPDQPWYEAHGRDISHVIALVSDKNRREMIFCIEYFGLVCAATTIPFSGETDIHYSYAVEVTTGQSFDLSINEDAIRALSWTATHKFTDISLRSEITNRMNSILKSIDSRGFDDELSRIIERALGPCDGRIITKEDIDKLMCEITPFIFSRIRKFA